MANLARIIKKCRDQLTKTKEAGKAPRSWLVTAYFARLLGKNLFDLPVLNSRLSGSFTAKGTISDIMLLAD